MILNNSFIKRYGISGNGLKILALVLMLIDHVGAVLLPQYRIMRYIGRLSFPIYCFLITEGVIYTHNIVLYGVRLLAFAVISEIPFDLAIYGKPFEYSDQNVFFTLFIGMAVVYCAMLIQDSYKSIAVLIIGMGLALFLKTDYSAYGIIMIYSFYVFRYSPVGMILSIGITNVVMGLGGTGSQKYAVLALIFIFLYSGNKTYGGKNLRESLSKEEIKTDNKNTAAAGKSVKAYVIQYGFYAVYPIHLIILYLIKTKM